MARSVEDSLVVRMEASLRKFERQMDKGRQAANTAAIGAERAWKRSGSQITANANRAATGIGRLSKISGSGRFVLQNTANQIGDMAVQLEGGTNAMRVMGQQLPQVLGGFGALGGALGVIAPLLGTVAAVGLPLAAMFLMTGDEAEGAGKKAKTFADRLGEAESSIKNAAAAAELAGVEGLENLGEMFGEITEEVRDLALALFEIEERAAKVKIGQILDEVTGGIVKATEAAAGAVDSALAQAGTDEAIAAAAAYREEINRLQESIDNRRNAGILVDQAEINLVQQMRQELAAMEGDFAGLGALAADIKLPPELLSGLSEAQAALQGAREVGDFQGIADQLSIIRDLMQEAGDIFAQDVVDSVTLAEEQARLMAQAMEEGKAAAEGIESADMAGAIGGAANEAVRLANELGIGLDIARKIAALGPQRNTSPVGRGRGGDPRDFGGSIYDWQNKEADEFLENYKPPRSGRSSRSRGGGGSGKAKPDLFADAEKQLLNLERQIEMIGKTADQVAELTAKYKLLDEAKERGLDLDAKQAATGETIRQQIDRQAKAIGNLTREKEQATQQAAEMTRLQGEMKDGFIDAIIEGENFAGVMESVAKSLAKAALQAALFGDGPLAGSFGTGGQGGLLGGLFKGFKIPGFASGTSFAPGGIAEVGERGRELIHLPRGSKVFSAERSRGMMAGGAAVSVPIQVNIQKGAERDGVERRRGPSGQQIIDIAVSDSISSGRQDGPLGSRFGAKPQKVRR